MPDLRHRCVHAATPPRAIFCGHLDSRYVELLTAEAERIVESTGARVPSPRSSTNLIRCMPAHIALLRCEPRSAPGITLTNSNWQPSADPCRPQLDRDLALRSELATTTPWPSNDAPRSFRAASDVYAFTRHRDEFTLILIVQPRRYDREPHNDGLRRCRIGTICSISVR
jgi:hypothetical protein